MEARHGVYVLVNSEVKGVVKIGMTMRHVNDRIPELHQTGTIGRFSCVGFIRTDSNPEILERKLHGHFAKANVNNEYFRVSPETVIAEAQQYMSQYDTVVISPAGLEAEQARQRIAKREADQAKARAERLERERAYAEERRVKEQAYVREQKRKQEAKERKVIQERKSQETKSSLAAMVAGICVLCVMFGALAIASSTSLGPVTFGSFISTMIFLGVLLGGAWLTFTTIYNALGGV